MTANSVCQSVSFLDESHPLPGRPSIPNSQFPISLLSVSPLLPPLLFLLLLLFLSSPLSRLTNFPLTTANPATFSLPSSLSLSFSFSPTTLLPHHLFLGHF